MPWIREHSGDETCRYCHAVKPGDQSTCIARLVGDAEMRPEPARREYAVDDANVISARIAELRKERDEAINKAGLE